MLPGVKARCAHQDWKRKTASAHHFGGGGAGKQAARELHHSRNDDIRQSAQALDIFVSVFGAETGNLALKMKSVGGIFLAGGIAPKILPKLQTSNFLGAFLDKGRLRRLMAMIPIQVITDDKLALLGAARCALLENAA